MATWEPVQVYATSDPVDDDAPSVADLPSLRCYAEVSEGGLSSPAAEASVARSQRSESQRSSSDTGEATEALAGGSGLAAAPSEGVAESCAAHSPQTGSGCGSIASDNGASPQCAGDRGGGVAEHEPAASEERTDVGRPILTPMLLGRSSSSEDATLAVGPPRSSAVWLLKRTGSQPSRMLADWLLGSGLQSLFWRRRFFDIGLEELSYRLREGAAQRGSFDLADVHLVAVMRSKVFVQFTKPQRTGARRRSREALCLAASSPEEAEAWADALRSAVAGLRQGHLPRDWDVCEMLRGEVTPRTPRSRGMFSSDEGPAAARLVAKKPLPEGAVAIFQRFIDHSFVCKKTQDRRGDALPLRLEVVHVFGVQNVAAWTEYTKARTEVARQVAAAKDTSDNTDQGVGDGLVPNVRTATLDDMDVRGLLGEVDLASNEHWLFHGSTPEAVQSITESEFRINLAGSHRGMLYGRGVYLAECCSKADEYAEVGEDGLHGMLVCRVALGHVLVDKTRQPCVPEIMEKCLSGEYQSLCGDRWAAVGTFREFVVYRSARVYPAYMVFYKRWGVQQLIGNLRSLFVAARDPGDERVVKEALSLALYAARVVATHPSEMMRSSLAMTIRAHGDSVAQAAIRALSAGATSDRRRAALLLGTLGTATPEVLACLAGGLLDEEPRVRAAACEALGGLGALANAVVPQIDARLGDDCRQVRAAAASALGALAAASAVAAAAAASLAPEEAAFGLGGVPAAAVEALLRAAEDRRVRVHVVAALARLGAYAPRVLPVLATALADDCGETRAAAARACAQFRDRAFPLREELLRAASDERADVRAAAIKALGQFGPRCPAAVPEVGRRLEDSDDLVCIAAAEAMGKYGRLAAASVPLLSTALHHESAEVRKAVLAALAELGHVAATAMPSICFMLHDPNADVVEAANGALEKMGDAHRILKGSGVLAAHAMPGVMSYTSPGPAAERSEGDRKHTPRGRGSSRGKRGKEDGKEGGKEKKHKDRTEHRRGDSAEKGRGAAKRGGRKGGPQKAGSGGEPLGVDLMRTEDDFVRPPPSTAVGGFFFCVSL